MFSVLLRSRTLASTFPLPSASFATCTVLEAKRWKQKNKPAFQASARSYYIERVSPTDFHISLLLQSDLRNPVSVIYGGDEASGEQGYVYDKKPFRVRVQKYHVYDWCGCGMSNTQPFCDGTHLNK